MRWWYNFKIIILEAVKKTSGIINVFNTDIKRSGWWNREIKHIAKNKKLEKYLRTKSNIDYKNKWKQTLNLKLQKQNTTDKGKIMEDGKTILIN